ncbi:MAG: MFS transporter [Patescibacteria group bacterium]|jgi:MFS family permease
MDKFQAKRNLILYGIFQALREPLFWGPIIILYLQQMGHMSLSSIYLVESITMLLLIVLQIPTGALADLLGRKNTMIIGSILVVLDNVLFALVDSLAMVLVANLVWAVGFAFVSGADSSFLYDTLAVTGETEKYKKIEGRTTGIRLLLIALTSIFVGYLASVNLRLPVWLGIPGMVMALLVVCLMKEPPRPKHVNGEPAYRQHWSLMKLSVLFVANSKKLKWIIAYTVLLGVIGKAWFFTYNPYFEMLKLPLHYYGWIFFAVNVVAAIFSYGSDWLAKKLTEKTNVLGMVMLTGVPIILLSALVYWPMVVLVLTQSMVRGHLRPFMGHFLHDHLDSENRATVVSIQAAVDGFGQFAFFGIFGLALKAISLTTTLFGLGMFSLLLGGYLYVKYLKIFHPKAK